MHAITLAELASSFVGVASTILKRQLLPSQPAAQMLWTLHRSRCDEWNYRLASHRDAINRTGASQRVRSWQEVMPLLQEILLTEPLSRTLACFASQLEELSISDELSPLMQSSLVSHIEARHRCLNLMVFGPGISVESSVRMNRLRRNLESYTDQLLAALPNTANIEAFCFNSRAVLRARTNASHQANGPLSDNWLSLHMQSLESQLWRNLQGDVDWRAANGRLNHRISQAVLGLLPARAFDDFGIPRRSDSIIFTSSRSPESDGKALDPAAVSSPFNMLFKHPRESNPVKQPHNRRW